MLPCNSLLMFECTLPLHGYIICNDFLTLHILWYIYNLPHLFNKYNFHDHIFLVKYLVINNYWGERQSRSTTTNIRNIAAANVIYRCHQC